MNGVNTCDRCSDEYRPYHVLIRDNFTDMASHTSCKYDNLCKPCRMYVTDYGAYLTETELEELEPKRFVFETDNLKMDI